MHKNYFDLVKIPTEKDMGIQCNLPGTVYGQSSNEGLSDLSFTNDEQFEIYQMIEDMIPEIRKIFINSFTGTNSNDNRFTVVVDGMLEDIRSIKKKLEKKGIYSFELSFCENKEALNKFSYNANSLKSCINDYCSKKDLPLHYGYVLYDDIVKQNIIKDLFEDYFEACKDQPTKIEDLFVHLSMVIAMYAPFFEKSVLKKKQEIKFSIIRKETKKTNNMTIEYIR